MALEFSMYNGFLITDDSESNVKAYRNGIYYAGNVTSYEASSPANIGLMIDEAGDQGYFTVEEYNEVMRLLGRPEFDQRMLPETEKAVAPAYPSYIMEKVRQHLGLDIDDTSRDKEINGMSHDTVFYHCLTWEGIIGYEFAIKDWVRDIYGVTLD